MQKGLTLTETLIVLAIVGTIMAAGIAGVGRLRAGLELRQAQQLVVREFSRARSDARRLGIDQTVTWTKDSIKVTGKDGKERVTDLSPSDNFEIVLADGATEASFSYNAPYSTTIAKPETITIQRKNDETNQAKVLIYGVRGKVFASR